MIGHAGVGLLVDLAEVTGLTEAELFGPVASDPTARRLLSSVDDAGLARLRRARVREVAGSNNMLLF